jgi:hypothetical protein
MARRHPRGGDARRLRRFVSPPFGDGQSSDEFLNHVDNDLDGRANNHTARGTKRGPRRFR